MQQIKLDDMLILGTIVGKRGKSGMLILHMRVGILNTNFHQIKYLFIKQNTVQYLPYFIKDLQNNEGDFWYLNLEEINSPEQARTLIGQQVFVNANQLSQSNNSHYYNYQNYQDYLVIHQGQKLAKINAVLFFPQPTAQIFINNQEILFPLHEDYIVQIDNQAKIIYMDFPDGLIDIYQS